MTTITLNKGGAAEAQVELDRIEIADLWHIGMKLSDAGDQAGSRAVLATWHLAHDLLNHIRDQEPKPRKLYDACPDCGCTDVEVAVWANANTLEVNDGDGPCDDAWCPQCECYGIEGIQQARFLDKVTEPRPFDKDRDLGKDVKFQEQISDRA